jgi:uncharacterized protein (TIGR03437 family)
MKCAWVILSLCAAAVNTAAQTARPANDDDHDHPAQRWQWFVEQRSDPSGALAGHLRLKALRQMDSMMPRTSQAVRPRAGAAIAGQWTNIGPQPISGNPVSSGRIAAMAVSQQNSNVVYVGAADGGVWQTTNGGATWNPLGDQQPSMAIGALAIDPQNPNTIYAGTGEADNCSPCYYGAGILKSTDGGATWTNIQGPFVDAVGRGVKISSIAVSPQNSNIVLAAAAGIMPAYQGGPSTIPAGIYRSTDAGATWTLVAGGGQGTRVIFNPANPSQVFATISGVVSSTYALVAGLGVFVSNDAGATWTLSNGTGVNTISVANSGRIELAMAPSNPLILYASVTNNNPSPGNLLGFYTSTDGGQNWTMLTSTPDYCQPQCWYDNALAVDPTNPSIVYAGGIELYRTTNGGQSWSEVDQGELHVDHHALAYSSGGAQLYDANDGGVWMTSAPRAASLSWSNLNTTLSITQFYPSLSIHPGDLTFSLAGSQDNGTQLYSGTPAWHNVTCGDGGWTVIDPTQSGTVYATCQYADIEKSTNGGTAWSEVDSGIDQGDAVNFIPPIVMDPSNPRRLYFGTYRMWQTINGAGAWTAVSGDLTQPAATPLLVPGVQTIRAIAVAPSDGQTVYSGSSGGQVYVTSAVDSGDPTSWVNRSQGLPPRFVTQIQVDPAAATTAYVSFSGFTGLIASDTLGHVFSTHDGGITWVDISGNLPNIPVNDMQLDPDAAGTVYVATDIGVFVTANSGANWQVLGAGLPRVVVMGLRLHRASRTLRVATHGRGVWDILVPLAAGVNPVPGLRAITPPSTAPNTSGLTLTLNGAGFVTGTGAASTIALWNGQSRPTTVTGGSQLSMAISASDLSGASIAQISVMNPSPGGGVSNALSFEVGGGPAINTNGIVSAATFALGTSGLAPGSLASLFGTSLGSISGGAPQLPLPTALNNVTVNVNSLSAPLIYVSPQQINFQIPWEAPAPAPANVVVNAGGTDSPAASLLIAAASPGIFTLSQNGAGQGAILIANTATLAGPTTIPGAQPAAKGQAVSVFCTGLGAVSPPQASGQPAGNGLVSTTLQPTATIGGQPAVVLFSGLAPGFVGLYQVNVSVPASAPSGSAVPFVLTINGVASNTVTMAIQ